MCYLPYIADIDSPAPPVLYTQSLKRHRVNIKVTPQDEIYSNPNNKKDVSSRLVTLTVVNTVTWECYD